MANGVSAEELAKAFQVEELEEINEMHVPKKKARKKGKTGRKSPKLSISLAVFIVGIMVLIGGLTYMIVKLVSAPDTPDAIFLTEAEGWMLNEQTNCAPAEPEAATNCMGGSGVIWKFTEVGKGTLTTNNHLNDYDFIWALDGNTMKIETDWLYTLNDEYKYDLNQRDGVLTLTREDDTFVFVMTGKKSEQESE